MNGEGRSQNKKKSRKNKANNVYWPVYHHVTRNSNPAEGNQTAQQE